MDEYLLEAIRLFGNPQPWADCLQLHDLPGMERKNVFQLSPAEALDAVVPGPLVGKTRNVAVIGINPTGIAAAFRLKQLGRSVTLLPAGVESAAVRAMQGKNEVTVFFERHGIAFQPHAAKSLRGSQVHCQSGYCPYVCEGRFIEESAEVGRIVTDAGNVYADIVILAAFGRAV